LTEACSLLATGSLSAIRWEWDARACALPVFAGAETAPLRETRFSRHFRALAFRRPALRLALRRRGGLCTPARKPRGWPRHVSIRPRATCMAISGNDMPRLASGLATRARGPRPSETTTPALSPAFHRKATRLGLPTPRRGGLRPPAGERLGFTLVCPR